ncbi:MAG TPA: manganese efflux pump MntP family protein [Clostridia bacterium]
MKYLTVVLLGLSLSIDAAAASAASGACDCSNKNKIGLKCATLFAIFQGGMTLLGYLLGTFLIDFVNAFAHWIAFGLLAFIGGKMIIDSIQDEPQHPLDYSSNKVLLILAVATSIDAFAVGLSLTIEKVNIYLSAFIIALITMIMCIIGSKIGNLAGKKFEKKALIIGGIILIGLGIKILVEHIFF